MDIKRIIHSQKFSNFIYAVILLDATLIGVETFYEAQWLNNLQSVILTIYVIELILRFIGKNSTKEYFYDPWNYFDIFVVIISFIPNGSSLSILRSLRVLRVLRAIRTIPELRLISNVLIKSITSLSYTGIFFGIFTYIYAVIGVTLFKFQHYAGSAYQAANNGYPDPYGNLSEAYFTLFRILTGEDWTDLRYLLLQHSDYSPFVITTYHVSWMIISSFLLINLVVGAVINNYETIIQQEKEELAKELKTNPDANKVK